MNKNHKNHSVNPTSSHPYPIKSVTKRHERVKKIIFWFVLINIVWLAAVIVYQMNKPLPPGVAYEGQIHNVSDVEFLTDLTYPSSDGSMKHEQQIMKRMEKVVSEAEQFLVIDLFLFNNYQHTDQKFPQASERFTNLLINKKKDNPAMEMVFITDEVNTNYNSHPNALLERMKQHGIRVVVTDVDSLRDPTPIYSAVWRTYFQWFGQSGTGWLPNLMASDGPDVTLRSYLKLLNVKANHRKLVASEKSAIVSSANVHDPSIYHSNIAFEVSGNIIGDMLKAEQAVLDMSGGGQLPTFTPSPVNEQGSTQVRYLTEGKVANYALDLMNEAEKGDTLWMGMFYLADRDIKSSLLDAASRGVSVKLILDPNENAFGQKKIGIPNRPVAQELVDESKGQIEIRWYNTTKEQYHTKLLYLSRSNGPQLILGGSTNFTPRNLNNYNLENDLYIEAPENSKVATQVNGYFQRLWTNKDAEYTLDLAEYKDDIPFFKDLLYKLQYSLGFTTF
ncbi:phospholipase D family protein [Paenibacillus sp. Marseille-Q4541]|uniref:phospholipase D family protein n=1 Tax=Paenibacillus sp. Marseille-Q4541 TaxID=2831522 RepID=UPI001BA648D0|nr:phospholipase D family protein [Paenibacillus sp. Marseille-Q4541]